MMLLQDRAALRSVHVETGSAPMCRPTVGRCDHRAELPTHSDPRGYEPTWRTVIGVSGTPLPECAPQTAPYPARWPGDGHGEFEYTRGVRHERRTGKRSEEDVAAVHHQNRGKHESQEQQAWSDHCEGFCTIPCAQARGSTQETGSPGTVRGDPVSYPVKNRTPCRS